MQRYPFFLPTDSYKLSHYVQYPPDTERLHCYVEARSGVPYDRVYFWGLSYYLQSLTYWADIFQQMLQPDRRSHCCRLLADHGFPDFNPNLMENLARYVNANNKLPLSIYALPQGRIYSVRTPLFTVENTDPEFFWLPPFVEPFLLKTWYPCTVATRSYFVKELLTAYWKETSDADISGVDFQFHNFGDRASSSTETAYIGGRAHLQLFKGTDIFLSAVNEAQQVDGFSIPAMEHSTVSAWGENEEFKAFENMLTTYKRYKCIAMVMDSYDVYRSVDFLTGKLKACIESDEYPMVVLRPDSGNPIVVLQKIIHIMQKNEVAEAVNSKGYRVWKKYRIIWGDGVNYDSIKEMLILLKDARLSSENISFGSGSWLMQQVSRDTLGFAYKASAIYRKGAWQDIHKNPITDSGKKSRKGLQTSADMVRVY